MADDSITISIPTITAVIITPNPATINTSAQVKVTASEITKTLYPDPFYLGEIYCGEA